MSNTKPDVVIDPHVHFCDQHMRFLKDEWPTGYATFAALCWKEFIQHERICDRAGGKVENLQAALGEFSPICCYLGDTALKPIVAAAQDVIEKTRGS